MHAAAYTNGMGSDLRTRAELGVVSRWRGMRRLAVTMPVIAALTGSAGALGAAPSATQTLAGAKISVSALPHELSPWAMFLGADGVVKAVIALLVVASMLTWTVWLAKCVELSRARRQLRTATQGLEDMTALAEAAGRKDPVVAMMVTVAQKELAHSVPQSIKERVAARLERIEASAARRARRGITVLASIGATAPFVGLFGTVWGIMNSFIGISKAQTTNLAVVAPGIAEALLATGLGLAAAIPAVLIYNSFTRSISDYRAMVADAATLVMCIASRELDQRDPGPMHVEYRRPVAVR